MTLWPWSLWVQSLAVSDELLYCVGRQFYPAALICVLVKSVSHTEQARYGSHIAGLKHDRD